MKKLVKTTYIKLFLFLILAVCFQNTNLFGVQTLQGLCAKNIAKNIDLYEFVKGLISGDTNTFKFLEDVCETDEGYHGFAEGVIAGFFVRHKMLLESYVDEDEKVVVWSPDGRYLAYGSETGIVKVWDKESGAHMVVISHKNGVESVAWSSDGRYLASGSRDNTVKVWDRETGERKEVINHYASVLRVAWSSDGRYLASGARDNTVKVWDRETGWSNVVINHNVAVNFLAWSLDGRYLASGSAQDDTVKVCERGTWAIKVIINHKASAYTLAWSPDGRYLAYGSRDNTVNVWDGKTGECKVVISHEMCCRLLWSPDGRYLASDSSEDGTIKVWDREAGESKVIINREVSVHTLTWSPEGRYLAYGSKDKAIKVWDRETEESKVVTGHEVLPYTLKWSPNGRYFTSRLGKTLEIWDGNTWRWRRVIRCDGHINSAIWGQDGDWLTCCEAGIGLGIFRKITDLNQVLLILILKYLHANNRMRDFYDIVNLPHLNKDGELVQLILAWFAFNPIE